LHLVLGGTAGQRSFRCVGLQPFWAWQRNPGFGTSRTIAPGKTLLRDLFGTGAEGGSDRDSSGLTRKSCLLFFGMTLFCLKGLLAIGAGLVITALL
jgi:hypothetical protein